VQKIYARLEEGDESGKVQSARWMPARCHASLSSLCSRAKQRKCRRICCLGERMVSVASGSVPRSRDRFLIPLNTHEEGKIVVDTRAGKRPVRDRRALFAQVQSLPHAVNKLGCVRRLKQKNSTRRRHEGGSTYDLDDGQQLSQPGAEGLWRIGARAEEAGRPRLRMIAEKSPRRCAPR